MAFSNRTGERRVVARDVHRERERQAALAEALRREVDERRVGGVEEARRIDFLCECTNPACVELVSITLAECEFIRRVPSRLVVKMGHANDESERVLMEEPGRFQVVERFGSSDDVIAHLAPWAVPASNDI
jgi:hypothetical protein